MTTNIKLDYKPYQKQKEIHKAIDSGVKFIIVNGSRQSGKSYLGKWSLIKWSLEKTGTYWAVSPTAAQSKVFAKDIIKALRKSGLAKKNTNSIGDITISLFNGSNIIFKSAAARDSLRGSTVDKMLIDEAAFIQQEVIEEVLLPMLLTKKNAQILMVSTPKSKNWFYDYYQRGLDEDNKDYYSNKITYKDSPYINQDLINSFRSNMPIDMFRQEFEGDFIDSASCFSNINDLIVDNVQEHYAGNVYVGIDIGLKNDKTVITVINDKGQMIFLDKFTGVDTPDLVNRALSILNRYKVVKVVLETNGIGLPIYHMLRTKYPQAKIHPFTTTNDSKQEIIANLINRFSTKEISILNDKVLIQELNDFVAYITPSGKLGFKGSTAHDDTVMSLALAFESLNKFKYKNISLLY